MPTYKVNTTNGQDVRFVQNGVAYVAAGDGTPLILSEVLNPIPAGIVQTSQQPYAAPVLASWSITGTTNGTFTIPQNIPGRYRVWIYCIAGQYSITFNGNGGVPIILGAQMAWDRTCQVRVIDVINVTNTSTGTLIINVESY